MQFYIINKGMVIYEKLDNEVIVINFNSGDYFALPHMAKQVWQLIEKKISLEEIAQLLAHFYPQPLPQILGDLQSFMQRLLEENLVLVEEGESQCCGKLEELITIEVPSDQYAPPELCKYSDMQSLLFIDPVHDVSEYGWPHTQESTL